MNMIIVDSNLNEFFLLSNRIFSIELNNHENIYLGNYEREK